MYEHRLYVLADTFSYLVTFYKAPFFIDKSIELSAKNCIFAGLM